MSMKCKYRLFQRNNGIFFIQNNSTGRQESLRTRDKEAARRIFHAKNEAHQQPAPLVPVVRAPEAPQPAPQTQPVPSRAVERRSAARPWVANGTAKSGAAKPAAPAPKFNKVADDDSDWKEF